MLWINIGIVIVGFLLLMWLSRIVDGNDNE
jgi:hypothetical protein